MIRIVIEFISIQKSIVNKIGSKIRLQRHLYNGATPCDFPQDLVIFIL